MRQFVVAVCCSLYAAEAYSASALHHYSFDNNGVHDLIGSEDGTLQGGASVAAGVLTVDGIDDFVQFNASLVPTTNFSVTFFAREISRSSTYAEIISQGTSAGPGFYIGYDPNHFFRLTDHIQNSGVPFPSDNLKHHYALTTDASDSRFYIDGALVGTFGSISIGAAGDFTRLGRQFTASSPEFSTGRSTRFGSSAAH